MFATRANQENAIYEQQTAAAAKPLNQGIKGLAPKTPGNNRAGAPKTPFRGQKNDENALFNPGKTGGKGGKGDKAAFVTPANPARARAPLGAKTANTKAFKTPTAPINQERAPPSSVKPTSPRLRRSKIKVHAGETENVLLQEPQEREIEYMPPREVPRDDFPDDIYPHDREYPELQGANFTRGWWSSHAPQEEEDEESELRAFQQKYLKAEAREMDRVPRSVPDNGVTAKRAASALATTSTHPRTPGFAAPTAAARARQPVAVVKKPSPVDRNPRFTAAKAASNSTIGYSKGRTVTAGAKQSLSELHARRPESHASASKPHAPRPCSTLQDLLNIGALHISTADEADTADDRLAFPALAPIELADDLEDFQLDLPGEQ